MGINEEEMARRMEIARMEMEEGQRRGAYDHILMNIEPTDACVAPHPHPARARAPLARSVEGHVQTCQLPVQVRQAEGSPLRGLRIHQACGRG